MPQQTKLMNCWCAATSYNLHYEGPWYVGSEVKIGYVKLVKCSACSTVRTMELADVSHTSGDHTGGHFFSTEPRSWDRINASTIARFLEPGSRLLDVGCNTGQLIGLLRSRYVAEGIDSNRDAVQNGISRGLNLHVGRLDKEQLGDSFDAVVISHLLEHVENPIDALVEAKRITRVEGMLFLFVPNIGSARARARLNTWSPLMPVDHVWHFTPSTLESLVKRAGWTPVSTRSTALNDASPHRWARPLHWAARVLNFGEQVALVARKTT